MKRSVALMALLQRLTPSLTPADVDLLQSLHQMVNRLESSPMEFSVTNIFTKDNRGVLDVTWRGELLQMSPVDARHTAWILLEAAAVADAEAMLMRFMVKQVGLDRPRALSMLADFRAYRNQSNAAGEGSLVGQKEH